MDNVQKTNNGINIWKFDWVGGPSGKSWNPRQAERVAQLSSESRPVPIILRLLSVSLVLVPWHKIDRRPFSLCNKLISHPVMLLIGLAVTSSDRRLTALGWTHASISAVAQSNKMWGWKVVLFSMSFVAGGARKGASVGTRFGFRPGH
jgi:hypothetical protein